jgi:hypothetical protein
MDRGGWSMRKEREKRANELAEKQAVDRPKASASILAAGRFYDLRDRRAGR